MSSLLNKITLKALKDKCKILKIKDYGTQKAIVTRIEQYNIANNLAIFS